ncbi:MAG: 3-deoxy-D-manno-octulosonic acid transferase [Parafilimonas sp.]|nr:3-deoxy-D-manno-octulosonic acid transferase [Parafilimonas sp.]
MDKFFYILFVKLYPVVAALLSPFNNKANLWLKGRKNIFSKIENEIANDQSKKIWMHCASLGEFEQGRPLLEKFRETYSQYSLVLTFFSPSGYEVQKNNKLADHTFYLPIDSEKNAKKFLDLIEPSLIVFVKYEYWYYYLKEAHNRKMPLLMVSGIFLPGFSFFKWYADARRQMLRFFTHFFVQTENSKQLLKSINITNATVSGDTRFDRVLQVASQKKSLPEIEKFVGMNQVIIAGSTWTDDDEVLDHFANMHPELKFIIAPHDIGKERIKECTRLYKHSILYSNYINGTNEVQENINTLIIDNIGMLKFLYRYATICYVGGGFNSDGIHNILEAAVYYKPVLFGPAFEKFSEAIELIDKGGAFDIEDAIELEDQLQELLSDENLYQEASKIAGDYVQQNSGATQTIMHYIQANRLLTN